jgi:hypothetical protein
MQRLACSMRSTHCAASASGHHATTVGAEEKDIAKKVVIVMALVTSTGPRCCKAT